MITENPNFDNYARRAFSKCFNDVEVNIMNDLLLQVKDKSVKIGDFEWNNWNQTPLPILPREKFV